jgi:hypothetical protein
MVRSSSCEAQLSSLSEVDLVFGLEVFRDHLQQIFSVLRSEVTLAGSSDVDSLELGHKATPVLDVS